MFTLKIIFVILLSIPIIVLAFLLLNKLFDNALKNKEKDTVTQKRSDRRRRRRI